MMVKYLTLMLGDYVLQRGQKGSVSLETVRYANLDMKKSDTLKIF